LIYRFLLKAAGSGPYPNWPFSFGMRKSFAKPRDLGLASNQFAYMFHNSKDLRSWLTNCYARVSAGV